MEVRESAAPSSHPARPQVASHGLTGYSGVGSSGDIGPCRVLPLATREPWRAVYLAAPGTCSTSLKCFPSPAEHEGGPGHWGVSWELSAAGEPGVQGRLALAPQQQSTGNSGRREQAGRGMGPTWHLEPAVPPQQDTPKPPAQKRGFGCRQAGWGGDQAHEIELSSRWAVHCREPLSTWK